MNRIRQITLTKTRTFFQENWKVLLLFCLLLIGIFIGAGQVASGSSKDQIRLLSESYSAAREGKAFFSVFISSLASALPFVFFVLISGFSLIGMPFILVVPMFYGLGYGVVSGYIYAENGLQGLIYNFLLIVPHTFLFLIALLFMCRESMRLSGRLFTEVLLGRKNNPMGTATGFHDDLKLYFMRYFVYLFLVISAAFLDAFCATVFSNFFIS